MQTEKEKIDELIKETLSQEEAKFYDELDEQSLFGKMGEVFRGKIGWLVRIMTFLKVVVFLFLIYCAVQFFHTTDIHEQITWGAAGFLCLILISMLRLFIWMQMNKNDVLRELKRLELQVAALSHKLDK